MSILESTVCHTKSLPLRTLVSKTSSLEYRGIISQELKSCWEAREVSRKNLPVIRE